MGSCELSKTICRINSIWCISLVRGSVQSAALNHRENGRFCKSKNSFVISGFDSSEAHLRLTRAQITASCLVGPHPPRLRVERLTSPC